MAREYKILGQAQSTANTLSTLYTVPGGRSAIISSITITNCNDPNSTQSGAGGTGNNFSIAVSPSAVSVTNTHLIAYRVNCPVRDGITLSLGITLEAGAKISINANNSLMSFSAFGTEIY